MSRTLYISARCEHCIHVLKGIKQYPFLKDIFKIVNVDTTPFPQNITSVPSIDINGQLILGQTVFEYLGKLVEGKNNTPINNNNNNNSNMSCSVNSNSNSNSNEQCTVNDDGELEGYCCDGLSCSMITDNDDNNTTNFHQFHLSYDTLDDNNNDIHQQVANMEKNDSELNSKHSGFDSDLEKLQRDRGDMMRR